MINYLITVYSFVFLVCYWGLVSKKFNGNLIQLVAIALGGFWCIWRAYLLSKVGVYGHPHEPALVSIIGLYAIGTIQKTALYCYRKRRAERFIKRRGARK